MITIYWYYGLTLLLGFCYFINHKAAYKLLLLSTPVIIALLLTTGLDYDHYKFDYETGFFSFAPPFFYTQGGLTAEPFYKIYTGFTRVITGVNFPQFLAINFYVCFLLFISYTPFKNVNNVHVNGLFWYFLLPVVIPTAFYFSPRSSISFFLVLAGFFLLLKGSRFKAIAFFILAISTHSQFIPVVFFLIVISMTLEKYVQLNSRTAYQYLLIYSVGLLVTLKFLPLVLPYVSSLLSFLPSADIAMNKLHYINSAKSGFRVTSILSIVVFPCLALVLYKFKANIIDNLSLTEDQTWTLTFYLTVCVAFGFCINVAYFDTPHLSGRLARFSDYISLGLLMPLALLSVFSFRVVVFVGFLFIISGPFLYPTVYSIH